MRIALFAPTRHRIALTHAGATFLEHARAVLVRAGKVVQQARAVERG